MGYRNLTQKEKDAIKSLLLFKGRIKRSTYWLTFAPFFLLSFIITIAFLLREIYPNDVNKILLTALFFYIPATWILISSYIKRWHDLGKSGWMVLIQFIPAINLLVFIYLGIAPGNIGTNKYGETPQEHTSVAIKSYLLIILLVIFLVVFFCGKKWDGEDKANFIFNELECGMTIDYVSTLAKNRKLELIRHNLKNAGNLKVFFIYNGKDHVMVMFNKAGNLSNILMPKWPVSFLGVIAGTSDIDYLDLGCTSPEVKPKEEKLNKKYSEKTCNKPRSRENIQHTFQRHVREIYSLYNAALKTDANLHGTMNLDISINTLGHVDDVSSKSKAIKNAEFMNDIEDVVSQFDFGCSSEKKTVSYPIDFLPD